MHRLTLLFFLIGFTFTTQASFRETYALSEPIYQALESARELAAGEQYQSALNILLPLRQKTSLTDYEQAQIWNLKGYIDYLQSNPGQAIKAYKQILLINDIPEALSISTLRTLAQLSFTEEDYLQAIHYAHETIKRSSSDQLDLKLLIAHGEYQRKQYSASIQQLENMIANEQQPPESWLQLLRINYQMVNDLPNSARVLEWLVNDFRNREYMLALSAVYSQQDEFDKQLTLLESLHDQQQLSSETHLNALVALYLQEGIPDKAAQVLEQGMAANKLTSSLENLHLLSQAYMLSRNDIKGIATLKIAAKNNTTGESDLLLARAYLSQRQWVKAQSHLEGALDKGVEAKEGVWFLLGMSQFYQNDLVAANKTLKQITASNRTSKHAKAAEKWLNHIRVEQARVQLLNENS
ncbi:tetratricopeptide repeat protein [Endozoicomonas ascidiicola]|uniref:tetratricopeptide repeat protein n=1 Tax=Endozoicomonas ascidiicola TaxID=1698521 RepID=UPI0008346BE2|nr:hypothetical protein [Endozoicomonas ascidiicola]